MPYSNVLKYCPGKVSHPRGAVIDQLTDALEVDSVWLLTGEARAVDGIGQPPVQNRSYQQLAFDEAKLFGEANDVAHTTLMMHLYHYNCEEQYPQ